MEGDTAEQYNVAVNAMTIYDNKRIALPGISLSFLLSGCAALVYELLFVRLLTLYLGHTTLAISAVLAAFMGGLAAGSFFGGRIADRLPRSGLLITFAALELATALSAAAVRPAIAHVQSLLLSSGILGTSDFFQSITWFSLSFLILILPTACMGATLPVLIKWSAVSGTGEGPADRAVGLLYGINTLGAVLGTLAAGFYFIPRWGVSMSFLAANAANILAALLALGMVHLLPEDHPAPGDRALSSPAGDPNPSVKYLLILFLTGFAAMVCEVAWTRAFALVLGSSTYAFSLMLLTFLLGLSLGSMGFGTLRKIFPPSLSGLGFILAGITTAVLLYLPLFNLLPFFFLKLFPLAMQGQAALNAIQFVLCGSVMIIPTFLMGLLLPWMMALAGPDRSNAGGMTGRLYTANTLGNIAGSAAAGLLLLPSLGAERSLVAAVIVFGASAVIALATDTNANRLVRFILPPLFALLCAAGIRYRPPWDPFILSSGVFLYAADFPPDTTYRGFVDNLHAYSLLYYRDGVNSSAAVLQTSWGERFMRINGKTDASAGGDMTTQLLLGYLPLALHPGTPRHALVIGLGSGATAGALATDPGIQSVDCVEIEPCIAQAARLFSAVNHGVLDDPRFHLVPADARHYLAASKKTYDIISSEPSNPWIAGVGSLFTQEAFETVKGRLSDEGIFCQWFHSYSISEADFRMVMKTFAAVFPHTMLLNVSHNDFILAGSKRPWHIDYARAVKIFEKNATMQSDLAVIGLQHPFTVFSTTFMLDDAGFRSFSKDAALHSDDHPTLEFSAPRYLHRSEDRSLLAALQAARTANLPAGLTHFAASPTEQVSLYNLAGEAFMLSREIDQADRLFKEAARLSPADARSLTNLGRVYSAREKYLQAERSLRKAIGSDPKYALAWFHLGMLYLNQGMEAKGLDYLKKGLTISPCDPMGNLQVGSIYLKEGKNEAARKLFKKALSQPIANTELRRSLMVALNLAG